MRMMKARGLRGRGRPVEKLLEQLESRLLLSVTYPDLQAVVGPADNPALPAGMDIFAPPVNTQAPAVGTPTFAEWTRTGGPDDVLAVTGDQLSSGLFNNLGKDTRFTVFGETTAGNSVLGDAQILSLSADRASLLLGQGLPTWSTYMIWPGNDQGYGRPALINQTDAWWVGPATASRGDTVSVYGRNLSHDNGTTTSWIYLKPTGGGAGQWVTPTAVNPYKVDFAVPAGLVNGTYEVWVHNGHGGMYGWSNGGTLTVDDGMPWTANTYNVKDYGAKGDGVTDDYQAIVNCYTAAKNAGNWNTVYFPAGTYAIRKEITPPANQRWRGDGMNSSTICSLAAWSGTYSLLFGGGNNTEIKDLTLRANAGYTYSSLWYHRSITNTRFTNVRFFAQGYNTVDLQGSTRQIFTNCEIIGMTTSMISATHIYFNGCTIKATNDASTLLETWGGDNISVSGCTIQDYDNSDPNSGAGWGQGRWFTGNGIWGSEVNTYIGDNTSINMAVRPGYGMQNTGEQIMWEGNNMAWHGNCTSATATTVSFASIGNQVGNYLTITDGKGVGQYRLISAYNASTNTLTLATPLNVIPDATSHITIGSYVVNTAVYHNTLDGKAANVTGASNASTGIEPFGGCLNIVATNNTMTDLRAGISVFGLSNGSPAGFQPVYWNLYADNSMTGVRSGISTTTDTISTNDPGSAMLGNVFRHTTINGALDQGISHNGGTSPAESSSLTVFDKNTVSNVALGINCGGSVKDTILYKNSFALGTATYSGSKGINFAANQTPALRENTWTGFATTYAGTTPGSILELPSRVLEASAVSGNSTQVTLTVRNVGSSSLNWSVSDNVDWLVASPASATVTNEGTSSSVVLTCTAKQYLDPGVYPAVITVTSGTQTQRATVYFTVTGTSGPQPTTATVTLTASDPSATESPVDSGTFTFTRSNGTGELRVKYSIAGTASQADYDQTFTGYLVFTSGQTTATLTITPNDDLLVESPETVQLALLPDEDYTVGSPSSGTVTITSNDLLTVSIVATDSQAAERNQDPGTFTITRSGLGQITQSALTVYYTKSGTASTSDYQETLSGSIVIPAGQSSTTLTITPVDDAIFNEGGETVILTLTANANYTIASPGNALVSIAENDWTAQTFDITQGLYLNRPTINGTVTQFGDANWWYSKGTWVTGNKGNGFSANPNSFTLLSTAQSNPYGFKDTSPLMVVNGDAAADGTAIIKSGTAKGTGVFVDAQNGLMVGLEWKAPADCYVDVSYTMIGQNAASSDLEFHLGSWNGTTWTPLGTPSWVLVTSANTVSNPLTLSASNVRLNAGDSIFLMVDCYDLDDYDGARVSGGVTYRPLPHVSITAPSPTATEQGQVPGTFNVVRDSSSGDLVVNYSIGGTATNTTDYATLSGSVLIPNGQTSAAITVTPVDDTLSENDETVLLTLASNANYSIGTPSSATVTILDNDLSPVTLVATTPNAAEQGQVPGVFTITRSGRTQGALTVNYSIAGMAANTADYATLSGSVVIPDGQTSATITVTPVDDNLAEGTETVLLTLVSGTGYSVGTPNSAMVSIADKFSTGGTWTDLDLGGPGTPGSVAYNSLAQTFTLSGSGTDIGGTTDSFNFFYQPLVGDGTLITRVTSVQNTHSAAKAGIMIRNTLDATSAQAMVAVTPSNAVSFLTRTTAGGSTASSSAAGLGAAPYWLKLVRSGNVLTAYASSDPTTGWTQVGLPTTIALNQTVYVGLAVTSHVAGTLCAATFDRLALTVNQLPASGVSLNVGTLQLAPGTLPNTLYQIPSLAITGGTLDLTNNDLLVANGATQEQAVSTHLLPVPAANGGATPITTTGVLSGTAYSALYGASFHGQPLTANALVLQYTRAGDSDLSGQISMDDYLAADAGYLFGRSANGTWATGDVNHDGKVNAADYALLDQNFRAAGAPMAGAMIELHTTWFGPSYLAPAPVVAPVVPVPPTVPAAPLPTPTVPTHPLPPTPLSTPVWWTFPSPLPTLQARITLANDLTLDLLGNATAPRARLLLPARSRLATSLVRVVGPVVSY